MEASEKLYLGLKVTPQKLISELAFSVNLNK
jgi:hypothetical protein